MSPARPGRIGRALAVLGRWASRLPADRLPGLGRWLARLLAPALRRRRRIAARNLDLCFPESDRQARQHLLDDAMAGAMTAVLENLLAWYGDRDRILALGEVQGLHHLHAALAQGRGALLLASHQLPMELGARILAERLGHRFDSLARRHTSAGLQAVVAAGRHRFIDRLLDKKDLRGVVRALRENRIVVLIGDQDSNQLAEFVPFFGIPASTLAITPALARLSGAQVLPIWAWRPTPGRYVVEIEPALAGIADAAPAQEAARYMAALEARVRRWPAQYLWQHRRFKTRPAGQPALY